MRLRTEAKPPLLASVSVPLKTPAGGAAFPSPSPAPSTTLNPDLDTPPITTSSRAPSSPIGDASSAFPASNSGHPASEAPRARAAFCKTADTPPSSTAAGESSASSGS